jgi:branched-chain amino acid transport system substrate-binding protein
MSGLTKIQVVIITCVIVVAAIGGTVAWYLLGSKPSAKESIRIGFTLSKSGYAAAGSHLLHEMQYILWQEQVNAKGGIYVKELDKRLPVEFVWYDDRSDIPTLIRLYEKLIVEDKVDFILPPWGTGFHLALLPLISKYEYPLIGSTCQSLAVLDMACPYFYADFPQIDIAVRSFVGFLTHIRDAYGITKIAIVYNDADYGVENGRLMKKLLDEEGGFDILLYKMYPATATDLSSLILEAKQLNVDAFIALSYPDDTALLISQSKELDFNPKVFMTGYGLGLPPLLQGFGPIAEGIIIRCDWHPKLYPGGEEYYNAFLERWHQPPDVIGGPLTYAACQILEQAIEKAGSLDRKKVIKVLDTETFATILGNVRFTHRMEGGIAVNQESPVPVGQIQGGKYEIIWPLNIATAQPLIPKPKWP